MSTIRGKRWLAIAVFVILSACGGGGSQEDEPDVPDVFVFFVSGHNGLLDGEPSPSYLHTTAGPAIVADLQSAGYTVEFQYYVDDALPVQGFGGYQALVSKMEAVRTEYAKHGTRVVVIAHSHGGVWAHAAVRRARDLTVTAQVDLDTSSFGWSAVGHDLQNADIGGDPRDRIAINSLATCPAYSVSSEQTSTYDLEDVVSPNVVYALEVRSGDTPVFGEQYDEKWNIRDNGSLAGLACYYSNTTHTEVHNASGETIRRVKSWLRERLAASGS